MALWVLRGRTGDDYRSFRRMARGRTIGLGFEKFIQDMENVQILADMAVNPAPVDDDAIGFDAIAQVEPGGHFFATDQTMKSSKPHTTSR